MNTTYTHDEVKAIIKFVLEEERLLDLAEQVQPEVEEVKNPAKKVKKAVEKEEKADEEVKKPKRLDHGKIMALHKGNWPVAKIADEMGCSEQAVRNHIAMEETR